MIILQIEANTISEFAKKIKPIYDDLIARGAIVEDKPKKKVKKKTKVPKTTPEIVELENPKPQAEIKAKQKDVHAALQLVNSERGMAVARGLLERFEALKLSDLKAQDYENFITACEQECRG